MIVVGYGHWGRALFQTFRDSGFIVSTVDARLASWQSAFSKPGLVLLSCPFEFVSHYIKKISLEPNALAVINASKGIDRKSLMTFSELAKSRLRIPFASLSGPSFSDELLQKKPTACSLASFNPLFAKKMAARLSRPYFRIYAHSDPIGVEVCASLKNVLAIACGISDGIGFGSNARAALLTRALPEMVKMVKKKGGKAASVFGLAGVGDLWLTASSAQSRNRRLGLLLGKGFSLRKAQREINETVEGIYTLEQVEKLRRKYGLELPICESVYKVVAKNQKASEAIRSLMSRELRFEDSSSWKLY
jgi:glycerol-3-phosphate dehydrogenase (NAD(P)+)